MKTDSFMRLNHYYEDEENDLTDNKEETADNNTSVKDLKHKPQSVNSPMSVSAPLDSNITSTEQLSSSPQHINHKSNNPPPLTANEVKRMIKKELDKHNSREDRPHNQQVNSRREPIKFPQFTAGGKPKNKGDKASKTVNSKTTPLTKQNTPKPRIYGSYDRLEVVNIKKELVYRLPQFQSQVVDNYSYNNNCNYGIFSVCEGDRDANTNMNYTLSFIQDCIDYNFCYIPIYLKNDKNEIEDIVFIVLQVIKEDGTSSRTFYDLQNFLNFCLGKYRINEYYLKQNNQFISISNKGNEVVKARTVRDVLITSFKKRKIVITSKSYYYFNTSPSNIAEKYERLYSRNEVCI